MKKYDVIYADPPWQFSSNIPVPKKQLSETKYEFESRPLELHYNTMNKTQLEEFFSHDVKDLAADDAVLVMWTTSAHLERALQLGALAGFEYKTVAFVWLKKTSKGNNVCYMGKYTCPSVEICLLFTKGKARSKLLKSRKVRQLVEAKRREHSRKPDEVRERIEQMFPDARKIELFARTTTPGWDVMGNETDKF